MDPTTASAAPRNVWHLNPKGTRVRVIGHDALTNTYVVETEKGVKTPVPPGYPLTPCVDAKPAAGLSTVASLVGRPRDQVEPRLPHLSDRDLEELGAADTRMWLAQAILNEIGRRTTATAPVALSRSELAPCLLCGVAYPKPTGLNHSHAECKANVAARETIREPAEMLGSTIRTAPAPNAIRSEGGDRVAMPLVEAAVTAGALTLPPLSPASLVAEIDAIETVPDPGARNPAYMAGRAAYFDGKPIDGDVPIVEKLPYELTVSEFEKGWREAERFAKDEPGFIKRVDPAFDGLPESVARGLEVSPTTLTPAVNEPAPSARGYCPDCGREGERLKNGAIRQHQPIGARPGAPKCDGSGKPALDAPAPKVAPTPAPVLNVAAHVPPPPLAEVLALTDQQVRDRLATARRHVQAGTGSALAVQEACDDALEAREFLRPWLRPALDMLERLPLRPEGWDAIAAQLRVAIEALDSHPTPSAAQESQEGTTTATPNPLSTLPETVPQSSAANAERDDDSADVENLLANPLSTSPTTAPEAPPEPPEPIRQLVGTVRESAAALAGCYSVEVLRSALSWEGEHQARRTVLDRIEERLHRIEAGTAKPRKDDVTRSASEPMPSGGGGGDALSNALLTLSAVVRDAARMGVRIEITITPSTIAPLAPHHDE